MSVSASDESRRRVGFLTRCPPPSAGGRTARRRPMGNSHDTLHEPTDRLRCRHGRAPGWLRDRTGLQAPRRGRAPDVPGPGRRRGRLVRRCAMVGGLSGSEPEGADPGGARQELRRRDRRRPRAGGPREAQRGPLGPLPVARLRRQRLEEQDQPRHRRVTRRTGAPGEQLLFRHDVGLVGARHLGPDPSLERGGPGDALRHRGRPARRVADAGQRSGAGVLRALGSRRAAADRPEQHGCLPAYLRSIPRSLQPGCRLEARDVARPGRSRRRPGQHPAAGERYRRQRKPDQRLTGRSSRPDSSWQADVRAADRANGAGRIAVDAPPAAPDLRQAEQQLVSANARIGVAKAEFFPKLSLTALLGTASPEVSALTGGTATIWAVAGMFSGPLFNAGRTLGTYRASIAQWEQARLQYEQAVLGALREVSDALTALGKLNEAETGEDTAVKALAEAVEHATDRYRQGLANYFEVLEAQQQLYPAQNTLAQIRRNRLLAYVQLYKALGGGWSLTDAEWTSQDEARTR